MRALGLVVLGGMVAACGGNKSAVRGGPGSGDIHIPPGGEEHVAAYDLRHSGKPDVWVYTVTAEDSSGRKVERRVRREADLNGDGKVDIVDWYDPDGQIIKETMDLDYDGKVDATVYFEKGQKVRSESDLDGDGKVDTWKYYEKGQLVRKERDVKGTGRIDYWEYWENGQLDRIGEDLDGDGTVDRWTKGSEAPATASQSPRAPQGAEVPARP